MGRDFIMPSAVCSFAPHSQAAVEAIPHLCVSERNKPTPVCKNFSLTHAGLGKLNPGGVGLTSLINVQYRVERRFLATPCFIYIPPIVLHWCLTGSFSSSSAKGKNRCLDLSCRSCPRSRDGSFSYKRCSGY